MVVRKRILGLLPFGYTCEKQDPSFLGQGRKKPPDGRGIIGSSYPCTWTSLNKLGVCDVREAGHGALLSIKRCTDG